MYRNLCFKQYYDNFITFEDPLVEQLCIEHWDTNHDNKLSKYEASQVNAISTIFTGKNIKSFKELQYFTSLQNEYKTKPFREMGAFENCKFGTIILPKGMITVPNRIFKASEGDTVVLSSSIIIIGETSFHQARIKNLIITGNEYIRIINYWGLLYANIQNIYVKDNLVDTYKQGSKWNSNAIQGYIGNILPISEYHSI